MSSADNITYNSDTNFTEVMRATAMDVKQFKTNICSNFFKWYSSFHPLTPRRDQFDILDHLASAPSVFLIKLLENGAYEYRLQGEGIVKLVGRRSQGKVFSSLCNDEDLSRFAMYLDEIVSTKGAFHSYGNLTAHNRHDLEFEALDFPLVNTDDKITHILGVMSLVPPN